MPQCYKILALIPLNEKVLSIFYSLIEVESPLECELNTF